MRINFKRQLKKTHFYDRTIEVWKHVRCLKQYYRKFIFTLRHGHFHDQTLHGQPDDDPLVAGTAECYLG